MASVPNSSLEAGLAAIVTGFIAFDSPSVKSQKLEVSSQESEKSPLLPHPSNGDRQDALNDGHLLQLT